jgi:hypothetical protein
MHKQQLFFLLLTSTLAFSSCKKTASVSLHSDFNFSGINQTILDTDKAMGDSLNITPYLEIYTGQSLLPDFTDTSANKYWKQCDSTVYAGKYALERNSWLRLTLLNSSSVTFEKLLCFQDFDQVYFDCFSEKVEMGGDRTPIDKWSYASTGQCVTLKLGPHQQRTYYTKCYKRGPGVKRPLTFILRTEQNEKAAQSVEMRGRMLNTAFLFLYLGFLFFCFIYFLAQYLFRLQEKILLVYALYILFTFWYSFRDIDQYYFLKTAFTLFNGIYVTGEAVSSYLSYIFYSLFVIMLLNLKQERKWAYRLIMCVIGIITVLLAADIVLRLNDRSAEAFSLFRSGRMLLFPLIVLYYALTLPSRGSYYKYFLWGSLFLVLGMGTNLLVHLVRNNTSFLFYEAITSRYGFWGNPVNYTRLGVIVEVLFFSLGLAKKLQVDFVDAALREHSAIETRFYTHEVKSALTTMHDKLDNAVEAERYATTFGNFLQKVLQLMKETKGIQLALEIEIAHEYFRLRQEDDDLSELHFTNTADINLDNIYIPAGLLIPFIQNFFDHAVTGTEEKSQLTLTLYKEGDKVNLKIQDNGGGLENIDVLGKPASSGLDIARRKINLFNTARGARMALKIENNKSSSGVSVTIINLPEK